MKNLLSENMLRFGTKNLSQASKRELVLKSIMETINQHGLHEHVKYRLVEEDATPFPGAAEAATYFQTLYKSNKLVTGSSYQATYTKFVIIATAEQIANLGAPRLQIRVHGLVKRTGGLWDVSEDNESLLGIFIPITSGTGVPVCEVNRQGWNGVAGTIILPAERLTATATYTLGQNASIFGGEANFVAAVKASPRYATDLAAMAKEYNDEIARNPSRANATIAKQIYTPQPTTKP